MQASKGARLLCFNPVEAKMNVGVGSRREK